VGLDVTDGQCSGAAHDADFAVVELRNGT